MILAMEEVQRRMLEVTHTMLQHVDRCKSRVEHMDDGTAVITALVVPRKARGRGFGSDHLHVLMERADRDRETLCVSPVPADEFGLSRGQLESWFIAHGFVPNRGVYADPKIAHTMYRRPSVDG